MLQKIFEFISSLFSSLPKENMSPGEIELQDDKQVIDIDFSNKVDIIIDKRVRTEYYRGWINRKRSPQKIKEIVIHGTAGGDTIEHMIHWMLTGERRPRYFKGIGLFHYLIGQDGTIVEILDELYWVYHSHSDKHDKHTIGIELINTAKNNAAPYTDAQYENLFKLIFNHLLRCYPTIDSITSHKYNMIKYSHMRYECPGNFEWLRLRNALHEYNYTCDIDGNRHYNLKSTT